MRQVFLIWAVAAGCLALPFLGWAAWGVWVGPRLKTAAGAAFILGFPSAALCGFSPALAVQARREWPAGRFQAAVCFGCAVLAVVLPAVLFWVPAFANR